MAGRGAECCLGSRGWGSMGVLVMELDYGGGSGVETLYAYNSPINNVVNLTVL